MSFKCQFSKTQSKKSQQASSSGFKESRNKALAEAKLDHLFPPLENNESGIGLFPGKAEHLKMVCFSWIGDRDPLGQERPIKFGTGSFLTLLLRECEGPTTLAVWFFL